MGGCRCPETQWCDLEKGTIWLIYWDRFVLGLNINNRASPLTNIETENRCFKNRSALVPGTLKEITSFSNPASWAFLARECDRTANSSCSSLETPKAAAKRSALWPIVSAVENSATAGSYKHTLGKKKKKRRKAKLKMLHVRQTKWGEVVGWGFYLRGEVCEPDATDQTQPLTQSLGLVEGQHGLPHLAAVADWNVRHEFHPSGHNGVTLAGGNQANGLIKNRKWIRRRRQRQMWGWKKGTMKSHNITWKQQWIESPDDTPRMNQVRLFSPGHTCGHRLIGGYAGHGDGVSRDLVRESCAQRCLESQEAEDKDTM